MCWRTNPIDVNFHFWKLRRSPSALQPHFSPWPLFYPRFYSDEYPRPWPSVKKYLPSVCGASVKAHNVCVEIHYHTKSKQPFFPFCSPTEASIAGTQACLFPFFPWFAVPKDQVKSNPCKNSVIKVQSVPEGKGRKSTGTLNSFCRRNFMCAECALLSVENECCATMMVENKVSTISFSDDRPASRGEN